MAAAYNCHLCRQSHLMEARATAMGRNLHPCQEEPVLMEPQSQLMEARATPMGRNLHPCQEEPVLMESPSHLMEVRHLMAHHRLGVKVESLPYPQSQRMTGLNRRGL